MLGMTDEGFVAFAALLLASVLDVSGLHLSMNSTSKVVNDPSNLMVACQGPNSQLAKWRNPKNQVLGSKTRPSTITSSAGSLITFLAPLRIEDSGNYTCSTDEERLVFSLVVEHPMKFTDTATNQTAKEGTDFVLKCEVTGGTVSWLVEGGGSIEESNKFKVIGDGLVIQNVNRHDSKTYICKGVQASTGTVQDRKIHLFVRHRPIHPSHPTMHMRQDVVYGYINGTVNLTCVAIAYPPATFEWKAVSKKAKIANIVNESDEVSILQLHIDNKDAFGDYKCEAKNPDGTYRETFTLKEGMKPPPPTEVQVQQKFGRSVILKILLPEKPAEMQLDFRGFSVQYRKKGEEGWKQQEFNLTQSNLYTLEKLEPNSEYELQAATRNAAGLSDYFKTTRWRTTSRGADLRLTLPLLFTAVVKILVDNSRSALW